MKIRFTIEVDDTLRRAIAHRNNKQGLASRDDIVTEVDVIVGHYFEDVVDDYDKDMAESADEEDERNED